MFLQTSQKRVLFPRTLAMAIGCLFGIVAILIANLAYTTQKAFAATNNTLNFQARLEGTGGNIVADGNYNVQFKLYNVSSAGTALWTETYLNSNSQGIAVRNGYLTANLGSISAFPGTINWDQDLWVTLNIGGTTTGVSPTYDGEMNPRLKLTGVPYAFRAGQLAQYNQTTGFTSTLNLVQPTVGNQVFQLADQGAAGTYTLCVQNSTACGFAASTGATGYIQNGTAAQTANFNIQSASASNVGAIVQGAASQSADIFRVTDSASTKLLYVNSAGNTFFGGDIVSSTTGVIRTLDRTATGDSVSFTLRSGSTINGNTGAFTLQSGNATGGNSGSVSIDVGSSTVTVGTINIGQTNATTINIGKTGSVTNVGGTLNVATAVQTGGTQRIDASGNLSNIANITGSGNIQMSGSGTNYILGALGIGTANPQAASALTLANGKWVSAIDAAGTGYVNMFQVNSDNQIQVGAALNVDGGIVLPTNGGQMTLVDIGIDSTAAAGAKQSYSMRIGANNALTVYGEADGAGNAQNIRIAVGSSINPQFTLDVGGDINTNTAYRIGGTVGTTVTCSGGNVLTNQVVQGGITTGGTCAAVSGGVGGSYVNLQATTPGTADTGNLNITGVARAGTAVLSPRFDAAAAGALTIADTTATSVTVGKTSGTTNIGTTINGTATFKPNTNTATSFQVQNSAANPILNVDSTSGNVTISQGGLRVNGLANPASTTLTTSATGGTLAANTYYYRVSAVGMAGETQAIATAPTSVTTTGTASRNTISWGAVAYATSYKVYRSTDNTNWFVNTIAVGTTSIIDNGSTYTWATSGTPSQYQNHTADITMQDGAALYLNGGQTGMVKYDGLNKTTTVGSYDVGGGIILQSDNLIFQDTTGYNNNLSISNNGAVTLKNRVNSATAFVVQNQGGGINALAVDTTGTTSVNVNGTLKVQDNASPIAGNLFQIQNNAATATYLGLSSSALILQDTSGNSALTFDSTNSILKIYENVANPTNYASISYASGAAIFAASSGTTQIGTGNGNINFSLTNAADVLAGSKTFTAGAAYTSNDYSFSRTATGGTFALQGNVFKIEDLSTFTTGSSSPNVLYINQNNAAATGNLILAQTGGSTTRLSLSTAGDLNISGVYRNGGTSGITTSACGAGSFLQNQATAGGIVTGGTCVAANTLTTMQQAYTNSTSPASILLTDAKNFVVTAADTATDPSVIFNLQCTACATTSGRFAIQNAGTDLFVVNGDGSIRIGDATNNVTFTATASSQTAREITFNGSARHTRRIAFAPEFSNVTMTGDGTSNSGTMSSDSESTGALHSYYSWTTTQQTAQDYDIWVKVQLPSDFAAWCSTTNCNPTIFAYAKITAGGTVQVQTYDTAASPATVQAMTSITPGSAGAWAEGSVNAAAAAQTWTAGGFMTLRFRLTAPTSGITQLGEIRMDYLSKW